jgi:hypothetical protein
VQLVYKKHFDTRSPGEAPVPFGRCLLILIVACTLVQETLRAVEAEVVGEEVTARHEVTVKPIDPAALKDPVLSLLYKNIDTAGGEEEGAAASVVDLPDEVDVLPRAGDGKWKLVDELPVRTSGLAREKFVAPGDPEVVRVLPDDEPAPSTPAISTSLDAKKAAPHKGDPETMLRRHPDEDAIAEVPAKSAAPAVRADVPRFHAGTGLDGDAAEAVAELLSDTPTKSATGTPAAALASADRADAKSLKERHQKEVQKVKDAVKGKKPRQKKKTSKESADEAAAEPEPEQDPEKLVTELIEKVHQDSAGLKEAAKEAQRRSQEAAQRETGVWARDPRAARAIEVLANKVPLSLIQGRVTDAATKQLLPVRVRVVDSTDLPANSPLPDGTWCEGVFNTEVISGAVKIEVSHGRFFPKYIEGVNAKANMATPYTLETGGLSAHNFAAQGWHLADLNLGLRVTDKTDSLWIGQRPTLADLILAARAEGVRILGVPMPWGDGEDAYNIAALNKMQREDMLLIPVFPGPRHAFNGCALAIGMNDVQNLPLEMPSPDRPLREVFDEIRARGGLSVLSNLDGTKAVNVRRDLIPLFPSLEKTQYFGAGDLTQRNARLYAATELPFDTLTGPSYDLLSFDGTPAIEQVWFNLLNQGYPVAVIGASGGSLEGGRIPFGQTFVQCEGIPTPRKVLDAIKAGRSAISFGPAAVAKILERDMGPGSVLTADGSEWTLQIQAFATFAQNAQIETVEIIRNGVVEYTHQLGNGQTQVRDFRRRVRASGNGWYMVRVTQRAGTERTQAWTSPIYFRTKTYTPPAIATTRVSGQIRSGLTPTKGTVTAIFGDQQRAIETDAAGHFKFEVPSSATLIFSAPDCEPVAERIFEHPKVQRELGALQLEKNGAIIDQLAKPSIFEYWRLVLSDQDWQISLPPAPPEVPQQ